jgi:hypothetical protein
MDHYNFELVGCGVRAIETQLALQVHLFSRVRSTLLSVGCSSFGVSCAVRVAMFVMLSGDHILC